MDQPPNHRAALEAMMIFLPRIEDPAFRAGEWVVCNPTTGESCLPYVHYHSDVVELLTTARKVGWISQAPAAGEWVRSEDVKRFLNEPDLIDHANASQLARLMTAASRAERFREGLFLDLVRNGAMLRILRRMRVLLDEINMQSVSPTMASLSPATHLRESNEMFYMKDGQKEDRGLYPDIDRPASPEEIATARRRAARFGLSDEALKLLFPEPAESKSSDEET